MTEHMQTGFIEETHSWLESLIRRILNYAETSDFAGYSKYDALNSPLLQILSLNNKYLRLIYTQAVMRAPINLRPWLFVPQEKNPKGIGLFAQAYCNLYDAWHDPHDVERANSLLRWLLEHRSPGDWSGPCWGYNFVWQTPSFCVPRYGPNMVVSTVVGHSFLRAYEVLGKQEYLDVARGIVGFIRNDLHVLRDEHGLRYYSYTPFDYSRVLNVSALGAGLMARIYEHVQESSLIEEARELIAFVVDKQTDYGAWYYTDPPKDSPLTHDNYHTGYILDAILQYICASGDEGWRPNYAQGLEFYTEKLFLSDGTPKFLYNRVYPIDIHGAAQGIISFSRASRANGANLAQAIKIAKWTESKMLAPDGHFYYQRQKWYTKRFPLMRWAQAWMSLAMSELLCTAIGKQDPKARERVK